MNTDIFLNYFQTERTLSIRISLSPSMTLWTFLILKVCILTTLAFFFTAELKMSYLPLATTQSILGQTHLRFSPCIIENRTIFQSLIDKNTICSARALSICQTGYTECTGLKESLEFLKYVTYNFLNVPFRRICSIRTTKC